MIPLSDGRSTAGAAGSSPRTLPPLGPAAFFSRSADPLPLQGSAAARADAIVCASGWRLLAPNYGEANA